MLTTIISGGQSGADLAGLIVGNELGLKTGGWIPRGFRTEEGNHPMLGELFGLQETASSGYPERTELNVAQSDMTVWFGDTTSPGYKLTKRMAQVHGKIFLVNPDPGHLEYIVNEHKIQILNVAGNRESRNPGIGSRTRTALLKAFGPKTEER